MQLLEPSGWTVAINPAWERLWGVSLADLAAYNIREDPQLRDNGVAAHLERAFTGEAVEIPSVAYVPPFGRFAGQPRHVRATASPILDQAGHVQWVVLVHEDVTELIEANADLEKAREVREESQCSAHVGTWVWDVATGSLIWTGELYRIYGLEPGDPLDYSRFLDLVHAEDRQAVTEAVEQALRDGTPFAFDHRIVRPDGRERTVHARGRVIHDAGQRAVRLVGTGQDVTERLLADQVERTFTGMWEHAPVGIAVYDTSDEFVCVRHNRRSLDLTNENLRRAGSFVGRPLRDLLDDDTYQRVRTIFEQVRETGEPFAVDEFLVVFPSDPEPRWYQWSLTPIRQREQVAWLLSTAVEITELVRARQEQQVLLDAVVEGIVGLDAYGRCNFINPAACRLLGYADEECLGHNMHDLVHAKRADGTPYPIEECPICQAVRSGHRINLIEETLWRKDGSPFRTLCSIAPLVEPGSVVNGAVVSITDIEDRLRAEEALRESEARFHTLVDATVAGVVLGDAQGGIYYSNDAFLRIVGYEREDLAAGRVNWARLTPPEWLETSVRALTEARERGGVSPPYEKEYVTKDGSRVPVLVVVARTEVDGEERWIATVLDLRERKELERLQRDFLAMVVHDLRSPLWAVRAGVQVLQRRKTYLDSTVEAILAATDRMARLIDDLGEVVRLESERIALRSARCDLVALVRAEVEALLQRTEQQIRFEGLAGPVEGHWDADRLAQVVQNLLGNAVAHAPGSDIMVRIEPHDYAAYLIVSDQGPGIDPIHLPHLFERFYRVDTGTGGLGLGLHISQMLVEAHGGRIWAESELGRGSTFTVAIPWSQPEILASA